MKYNQETHYWGRGKEEKKKEKKKEKKPRAHTDTKEIDMIKWGNEELSLNKGTKTTGDYEDNIYALM